MVEIGTGVGLSRVTCWPSHFLGSAFFSRILRRRKVLSPGAWSHSSFAAFADRHAEDGGWALLVSWAGNVKWAQLAGSQLQAWSRLVEDTPCFASTMAVQNFPMVATGRT